ncbi:hypothetical protein L6452_40460 [Arctium lappa]|uniref:Uncharacterized protein n=1 Tax=Arctium lappa TaxID=4217 RepID=A0ACB8XLF9_ARCLA|nr:hypothetical protein L6452_40460 [Arctium lappa]
MFQQCPLLNISYCPPLEVVLANGKSLVVVVYNSLGWKREEVVRVPVSAATVPFAKLLQVSSHELIFLDSGGREIESQLLPIFNASFNMRNYHVKEYLGKSPSNTPQYRLRFTTSVPPLGFSTYIISSAKHTDTSSTMSTVWTSETTSDKTVVVGGGELKLLYATDKGKITRYINNRNLKSFTILRGPLMDEVHQQLNSWIYQCIFPSDLVKLVERTIRSENCHFPNRPIYIVGESVGGCLALAVVLLPEEDFDLVTVIKGAGFYRRAKHTDYASDFLLPSPREIKDIVDSARWLDVATSPVMLSTLEDGKIVRSLSGIPSQGPILFVGCHNMLGFEVDPMIRRFILERNIIIRGVAHPMLFKKLREGKMPDLATYDVTRVLGAVPVSASNLYKLFSMKYHVLLYPGGVREALHRKVGGLLRIFCQMSE